MGAWIDSLDTIYAAPQWHFDRALSHLAKALEFEGSNDDYMLMQSQDAAAHIVAWRRTLPDQDERSPDVSDRIRDRGLLRIAVLYLLYADAYTDDGKPEAICLRRAEANLRTLWKRHREAGS